ncbi:MAG: hypothetical protein A2Y34_13715 [Spirochaetes bacterium GWC1_27_15]|nr:MAG: hypothetical protein A2Z98_06395 [Spirochaetes bacterium GWB1_27_13]OHD27525.1 MAG: hypothetical protein A2Y34_13715 [Spirochaetes bacterium GWC1_27_15]
MPRPTKCRKLHYTPDFYYFKPAGIPGRNLEEVILTLDEFEAIRLADFENLYQEDAAKQLNVSRQTFGNIIDSAHKKIADTIINGKILKIEGGNIDSLKERNFICYQCKNEWSVPFGVERPSNCPNCNNENIHRSEKDKGFGQNK